jgi:CheY-like chemotaxis protein
MKVIKCLIVDDEPPAIRLIEKYLSRVPFLELVSSTSALALSLIEEGVSTSFLWIFKCQI